MAPDLAFPDGAFVALDVPVVVGREPVAPPDLPGAIAVPIADMSVSKTHALIEWSGGSLWVTDLNSSNGTDLVFPDGTEKRLSPGIPTVFAGGVTIRVGSSSDLTIRQVFEAAPELIPLPQPAQAASWYDDPSVTVARPTSISQPPPAVIPLPAVVTAPPQPIASMVPFETQEARPVPVVAQSDPVHPVAATVEVDPVAVAAELEQRRRIGAWILAVWGGLTALLTLTRDPYSSPSLPLSFFWYPRWVLDWFDLTILIASIPLAVGVTAAWLLTDLTDGRRRSAVLWVTGAAMPLLFINVVGIPFRYTSMWSITSLVLPIAGAVLLHTSVVRVSHPAGNVVALSGQLSPSRAVAVSPGGLVPLPLGARIGCVLLDSVFFFLTLGIGWVIWSLVLWGRGQSPGKQVVGAVVVRTDTGQVATFGTMALRELVGKSFLNFISFGLTSIASIFMVLFSPDRRAVQDHVATTIVISVHQLDRKP